MHKMLLMLLALVLFVIPCFPWGHSIIEGIQFDANCGDYLKLAADANNVDIAEKHLTSAITYLEKNNLTSGTTKIFVYKPTNDIGLWYDNLKTAQTQLQEMQASGYTELEQSNMLMKLRETILDDDGTLTHPEGISLMPNYVLLFWLNWLLWIPCWLLGGVCGFYAFEEFM